MDLSHLKKDGRGYPIPFFVSIIDGKPDFKRISGEKQLLCVQKKLCPICGKKLPKDYFYFICGPVGFKNRISTDPAMHRECAEFSLATCPHIFYQKAERTIHSGLNAHLLLPKPDIILLAKVCKFKLTKDNPPLIRFTPVSFEEYVYVDNKLQKKLP